MSRPLIVVWKCVASLLVATGIVGGAAGTAATSFATEEARFDLPPVVACQDVTTVEFQHRHPGERLWEARLNLSVLARHADDVRMSQVLVRIDNPRRALRVVDYAPRTTLVADVQGTIRREHHAESSRTFDFHVKGGVPGFGEGEARGASRDHQTTDETYERLPPLALQVASGTTQRGAGVYFKLKPTTRSTLEGSHELTLWLAAPEKWAGDHLRVRCEAFTREATLIPSLDETVPWGDQDFAIALYREGDEAGRAAAESLVRAEAKLRRSVVQHRRALSARSGGDVVKDLATLWSGRDSRLPPGWYEQLVYGPPTVAPATLDRLPAPVREAAENFVLAKRKLAAPRADQAVARIERLPPVD